MKFKVDVVRKVVLSGLAAGLLASCGGGTQIEAFVPQRIIAFGDEASFIVDARNFSEVNPPLTAADIGKKYTVNGVEFDTTVTPPVPKVPKVLDCTVNQVWVQGLAYALGMAFDGCPGAVSYARTGMMYARPGHTVAQVVGQVDQFLADGNAFAKNDLVTVMAGTNDVLALYGRLATEPGVSRDSLIAAAGQAGSALGGQVVRITNQGAKVVVSTIPGLQLTPYAAAQEVAHPGEGRSKLLADISTEFNKQLRLKLNDVRDGGHAVGLILTDELMLSMYQFPFNYPPLFNSVQAACTVALPNCDMTTTLDSTTTGSYGAGYLWADATRMSATTHSRIAGVALNRVRSNPF